MKISRVLFVGILLAPTVVQFIANSAFGDSSGTLGGDGNGPVFVSLDSPFIQQQDGTPQIDRLGTSNVAGLLVGGQINPALNQNHIQVIRKRMAKPLSFHKRMSTRLPSI